MKKNSLTFEELARRCYPKATKEELERIVAKWKAKAKRMAAEPIISLAQFGRKGTNTTTVSV